LKNFNNFKNKLYSVWKAYDLENEDLPSDLVNYLSEAEFYAKKVETDYQEREKRQGVNKNLN